MQISWLGLSCHLIPERRKTLTRILESARIEPRQLTSRARSVAITPWSLGQLFYLVLSTIEIVVFT